MHSQIYHTEAVLKLAVSIGFFGVDDWPMVASIDSSSFAACIAVFKSQGFYAHTQAYVVGLRPSRNQNIASCKSTLAHWRYLSLNPFI